MKKWGKTMFIKWWILKMWYVHTMDYYITTKRNEVLICYNMEECENIMLNEKSQNKKPIYYDCSTWNTQNGKIYRYWKYISSCAGLLSKKMGSDCWWVQRCFQGDKIFQIRLQWGLYNPANILKLCWIVHFKWVRWMAH